MGSGDPKNGVCGTQKRVLGTQNGVGRPKSGLRDLKIDFYVSPCTFSSSVTIFGVFAAVFGKHVPADRNFGFFTVFADFRILSNFQNWGSRVFGKSWFWDLGGAQKWVFGV